MISDMQCPNCDNVTQYARICQCCGYALPEGFVPEPLLYPAGMSLTGGVHLDPRFERQFARIRNQIYKPPIGSMKEGEVPVILAVKSGTPLPSAVRVILRIEPTKSEKNTLDIITARVSLSDIGLLDQSFIIKYPSTTRVCTDTGFEGEMEEGRTIAEELGIKTHAHRSGSAQAVKVNVGIIDFGMDFAHTHFIRNGRTRIRAIWNQSGTETNENSSGVPYGTLYRSEQIDRALMTNDPYEALGYGPPADSLYETGAHGTYVADIAAGSGFGGQGAGLAPNAGIIFVDLARTSAHNFVGSRYGDSAQLLEAVDFILKETDCDPCVINISLGSNDGPHDGMTLVELGIDRLIENKPNCAVVIAGGNTRDQRLHASGTVDPGGIFDLIWYVPPYDMTSNEIELWYPVSKDLSVQILDPDNAPLTEPIKPGRCAEVPVGSGGRMMVFHRASDPTHEQFDGDKKGVVYIFYERCDGYLRKGRWKLRLRNEGKAGIRFDAWIERDERGQSVFVYPDESSSVVSEDNTLNSIAHGKHTIVVGSCKHAGVEQADSSFTSFSQHASRPDILAPGESVLAARSGTAVLRYRQTGTSMSAAVVTGLLARKISEGAGSGYRDCREVLEKSSQPAKRADPGYPSFRFLAGSDE